MLSTEALLLREPLFNMLDHLGHLFCFATQYLSGRRDGHGKSIPDMTDRRATYGDAFTDGPRSWTLPVCSVRARGWKMCVPFKFSLSERPANN